MAFVGLKANLLVFLQEPPRGDGAKKFVPSLAKVVFLHIDQAQTRDVLPIGSSGSVQFLFPNLFPI